MLLPFSVFIPLFLEGLAHTLHVCRVQAGPLGGRGGVCEDRGRPGCQIATQII